MSSIIGLSGSLRQGSYNSALLRAAAARMPAGSTLSVASIPNSALTTATPRRRAASGARSCGAIARAWALIATTYNNNGIPGVARRRSIG